MTTESSFNNIKQHDSFLIIATHNIQGMNDNIKFQQWIEFYNINNLDIISITETKLAQSKFTKYTLSNTYYYIFISNTTIDKAQKQEASMVQQLQSKILFNHIFIISYPFLVLQLY